MKCSPLRDVGMAALFAAVLTPMVAQATVETSLTGLKTALLSSILPIAAVMALGFAALQFFFGNPNSKQYLIYAISGSIILFGAQSIVDLLHRVVR